jgi:NAD(P)-dependent dehydrogenase (short-subunit alcohol dehydrogenase family)
MRTLVVGATGSIGRLVVEEAIRQGHKVRALVRSEAKGRQLPKEAEAVIGDLTQPESGVAWLPFGPVPGAKAGASQVKSAMDLLKPSSALYPSNCGVSIHLNETPAESDDSVVTSVRYQVLDIKGMNAFLARHRKH